MESTRSRTGKLVAMEESYASRENTTSKVTFAHKDK
jgi:hypothetical protein